MTLPVTVKSPSTCISPNVTSSPDEIATLPEPSKVKPLPSLTSKLPGDATKPAEVFAATSVDVALTAIPSPAPTEMVLLAVMSPFDPSKPAPCRISTLV